jgi:hypothetical protein
MSELRALLKAQKAELKTWEKVGRVWNVNRGLVYRIANEGYIPKNPAYIILFGLEMRAENVCSNCGHPVHQTVVKYRRPRKIREMSKTDLLEALNNRTDDFSEIENRYKGNVVLGVQGDA